MNNLTLDEAAAKYGIERKKLIGHCLRDLFDDPLVVDCKNGEHVVADDWRLQKLAAAHGSHKSSGSRE